MANEICHSGTQVISANTPTPKMKNISIRPQPFPLMVITDLEKPCIGWRLRGVILGWPERRPRWSSAKRSYCLALCWDKEHDRTNEQTHGGLDSYTKSTAYRYIRSRSSGVRDENRLMVGPDENAQRTIWCELWWVGFAKKKKKAWSTTKCNCVICIIFCYRLYVIGMLPYVPYVVMYVRLQRSVCNVCM